MVVWYVTLFLCEQTTHATKSSFARRLETLQPGMFSFDGGVPQTDSDHEYSGFHLPRVRARDSHYAKLEQERALNQA